MSPSITNEAARSRYEVHLDGKLAGFAEYRLSGAATVFTHTEIDPAFEGHGLGSALARGALDDVRRSGRRAVPLCPFIKRYIERHPEYQDLVSDPN
jgi:predicted GNAT family acetyltransferase